MKSTGYVDIAKARKAYSHDHGVKVVKHDDSFILQSVQPASTSEMDVSGRVFDENDASLDSADVLITPFSLKQLRKKRPTIPLTSLSKVLATSRPASDSTRLSAVNKQIGEIDSVRSDLRGAQTILLSNNYIEDVYGLRQFEGMKSISLANNGIFNFESISEAAMTCTKVENANFEGNPIRDYPHYRSYIISFFPRLKVLDNIPVTERERKAAISNVKESDAKIQSAVDNFCLVCFMKHIVELLSIHGNIRSLIKGRDGGGSDLDSVPRSSVRTLLASWKKENHFSASMLQQIRLFYMYEVSLALHGKIVQALRTRVMIFGR